MRSLRFLPVLLVANALLTGSLLSAQVSTIAPRIVTQVDESKLTRLSGNVPAVARAQYDRGEAAPATQLTHIRLVLQRSSEQEAALDNYLAQLQDKSSANYHKWLTPEQYGRLYGPADSDVAAIVAWLQSHGLTLEEVSKGRTNIAFSGAISQVEEAFHTPIHSFEANGRQFYSNTSDPSIPSALAAVVGGVAHLNTIRPVAFNIPGPTGSLDTQTKRAAPLSAARSTAPKPQLTTGSGTTNDPYFLYIVPGDAGTIYDTPNSTFNANYSGATYDGTGVKIGIGGDAPIQTSTVLNYRSAFMGNSTPPTIVGSATSTADADEAYIDTELSGGLAPGASIYYYPSDDLYTGIQTAINDNTIDIFSLSFGLCELELTTSGNVELEQIWQQAAGQGIAVTVSTGDNGSAACDAIDPADTTQALYGMSVSGFASTPYNIAVGGTDMNGLLTSFSQYAETSEGVAGSFYRTALGYIPESTWNDSTNNDTTISQNTPLTGSDSNGNPYANIVAGAGGKSDCSVNTNTNSSGVYLGTCTSGYAKPSWQRGTGVPTGNARYLPDVSLMAGNGFDPATWLVCTDDPVSGTTDTSNCGAAGYVAGYGGTSTAAPAFAGILALVEQKTGSRLGQAAAELYDLYNGTHGSQIFHDVTVGNNSVSCVPGSTNCTTNTAGYPYLTGFDTAAGYDEATGLGSVDAKELVAYWDTAVGAVAPTLKVTASASSVLTSQSFTVAVAVTGTAEEGTPTGTVTLTDGSYTSGAKTLVNGDFTFTVAAGALPAGVQTLTVTYSGDPYYSSATGTASVTVTSPGSFSLSASAVTVAPGSSGISTITVTATGGYTGTITLNSCTLATSTSGSIAPTCTIGNSPIVISSGETSETGTVVIGSASGAAAVKAAATKMPSRLGRWAGAGGIVLAGLLLLGIPARRRNWPPTLLAILAVFALGVLYGCGGGGSTTPPPATAPTATTGADSAVTTTSATLAGTVNPNGTDATASFLYGTSSTLTGATTVSATPADAGAGTTAVSVSANLTGLTPDTKYYYEVQAKNSGGTGTGSIMSFSTNAAATTPGIYTFTVTGTDGSGVSKTATLTVTVS